MKVLEFTSCIPFLKMACIWTVAEFLQYSHRCTENPELVYQKEVQRTLAVATEEH